ncbi:hypothetical protein COV24_04875 [candidate division WWE3 bacterium CG10_big_fil_rev_8_21_14_0_10_32_10]|uniref:PPM-type phosphatase domain-containing protein n=1 Tax=candidate division WWE3 bacterium CG10_big_fil_rev_8_21_14_0_10_32_10 TaxID=1975090 RepID=A0A2H0R928_UNCKA|nr:MAG: hypothetical protein COV24_04875 [candidate division WWE3 bacterium CG10_big_fil_rev_8_21_14_0_10_32_10]
MSAYDTKSQKILGSFDPQDGVWSIPFEYDPEDSNLISTRGLLYIVVDLEASPSVDLHLASKIIIDEIKEKYYGDLDGTPLQALETAVISGKNKLQEIALSNKESVSSLNFNIVSCVVWGRVLYVAQVGETSCLIIRGGEVVDISNKTSGEVMTSSGLLESEDVVLIGTKAFEQNFNNNTLIQNIGNLENLFKNSPQAASLSAVMIRFKKSMVPTKKDFSNLVSNLGGSASKNPTLPAKSEQKETTAPVEKEAVDTSKAINSLGSFNTPPIKQETASEKSLYTNKIEQPDLKRGRKPKKLFKLLGALFLIVALFFGGFKAFPLVKNKFIKTTDISVVDISGYRDRFNTLNKNNAKLEDYKSLQNDLQTELSTDVSNEDLISLIKDVDSKVQKLTETSKIEEQHVFFDFKTKNEGSNINKLTDLEDKILVSDIGASQAYLISKDEKSVEDIAVGDDYLTSTYYDNNYYVLTKNSVFVGSSVDLLKEYSFDEPLSSAKDVEVYFDNIYVLSGSKIYKYALNGDTYIQSVWADLGGDNLNSITIDGDIYVTDTSVINKYYTGEKQDFTLNNMPEDLKEPLFVTTARGDTTLYVLDKNYLYKINKDSGDFSERISIEDVHIVPQSFLLDGSDVYISNGSRLFKIGLK